MKIQMLFLLCLISQIGCSKVSKEAIADKRDAKTLFPKIVGGQPSTPGEFPFIVSLQDVSSGHFCGGSLVRKDWVLTAAHCVTWGISASDLRVVSGLYKQSDLSNAEVFSVKNILVHPQYDKGLSDYDFALIRLTGNSKSSPIILNTTEIPIPDNEAQAPLATTAGWGVQKEAGDIADTLMKVDVPLVDSKRCLNAYPGSITDRMICAGFDKGGKDSCQGDSGGPLLVRDDAGQMELIGIVSWGEGCARPAKYGVYSKVNAVNKWIVDQINTTNLEQ